MSAGLSDYSAIIWREAKKDNFPAVRFYDRRIRRIIPALFWCCWTQRRGFRRTAAAERSDQLRKSLLAHPCFRRQRIFLARYRLFLHGSREQKPLLHIWSLGVEEQFSTYFSGPCSFVSGALLAAEGPAGIAVLTGGPSASTCRALFIGGGLPPSFPPPPRAWELGLGAVLALLPPQFGAARR